MELRISIDDGRKDMLLVARLLDKYGLKGTFYIAPFEKHQELTVEEIKELAKNHRIGGHTLTHQRLTECSLRKAWEEIKEGKEELEEIIGRVLTTFSAPRGWQNKDIIKLIQRAGFLESRTTKMGITDITGYSQFELPCSAHMYPRPEYQVKGIKKSVIEKYEQAKNGGGYFNLLMHTNELSRYELWEDLDDILKYISKNAKN